MTRYHFITLLFIGMVAAFFFMRCRHKPKTPQPEKPSEGISLLTVDDPELARFKDTAQKKIHYLIEFMNEHRGDTTNFKYFVKSGFSEHETTEHMWSEVTAYEKGYFIGLLANDPQAIKNIKDRDSVRVRKQDVEDWRLMDYLTNTQVGGFSTDYLHKTNKHD